MSEEIKVTSGMTRRTFMKGAAATAAAVSLASILPAANAEAAKKKKPAAKKNGIYVQGSDVCMNGQTYTLEFIQPVALEAYIDGVLQTEGVWRTANKHLVSVDPEGVIIMRDGVGGFDVEVTWTLGDVVYGVTFHTIQTIGAHGMVGCDVPMKRADLIMKIAAYFNWPHYNNFMDDGVDIDKEGNVIPERVRNYYDVTGRADYVKPIEAALDQGLLVASSPDECFYPLSTLTREDAAVIICKAFAIEPCEKDVLKGFCDVKKVAKGAYAALNALFANNYMYGVTDTEIGPKEGMTFTCCNIIIDNITRQVSSPAWSMPTSGRQLARIRPLLKCPTPNSTIYWRARAYNVSDERLLDKKIQDLQMNGEWTDWKPFIQDYTIDPFFGMQQCRFLPYDNISHCVEMELKTSAPGKKDSPVTTYYYKINRPAWHDFAFDKLHEGDKNFPTVYRFFDNFQAAAYYIQGSKYGILFDGLMPTQTTRSLADWVNELATTDWCFVLGHEHGDHNGAQPYAFEAGKDIYLCKRVGSAGKSYTITTYNENYCGDNADILDKHSGVYEGDKVHEIDEGFVFDLGNCKFKTYRLPGHENAQLVLHDAEHGLIFASDIYGVNRYWVADQFSAKGVKQDLLLSMQQQLMVEYRKNGGKINEMYTGHNRVGVGPEYLMVWEQCLQKIVDYSDEAMRDDRRADGAILSIEGDSMTSMNWCGFTINGKQKVAEYVGQYDGRYFRRIEMDNTGESALVDSNLTAPHMEISTLSNINFKDAELVGHDFLYRYGMGDDYNTLLDDGDFKFTIKNKFFPIDTEYTVKICKNQTKVTFVPTTTSTRASLKVNGEVVSSRCPVTVSTKKPLVIEVTAPDGEHVTTYTFNFEKTKYNKFPFPCAPIWGFNCK